MATNNKVNFGSIPLHKIELRTKTGETVPAVISKLEPKDDGDLLALQQITETWQGQNYAKSILGFFQKQNKPASTNAVENYYQKQNPSIFGFYAVELAGDKPLAERVVGLAQTIFHSAFNSRTLDFAYLQTKPELQHGALGRKISGVGEEVLTGKVVNVARDLKAACISIISSNDDFYKETFRKKAGVKLFENNGIEYDFPGTFRIWTDQYQKYLDYIEQKYKTNL